MLNPRQLRRGSHELKPQQHPKDSYQVAALPMPGINGTRAPRPSWENLVPAVSPLVYHVAGQDWPSRILFSFDNACRIKASKGFSTVGMSDPEARKKLSEARWLQYKHASEKQNWPWWKRLTHRLLGCPICRSEKKER